MNAVDAPVRLERIDGQTLAVTCAGDWTVRHGMPSVEEIARQVASPPASGVPVPGAKAGSSASTSKER